MLNKRQLLSLKNPKVSAQILYHQGRESKVARVETNSDDSLIVREFKRWVVEQFPECEHVEISPKKENPYTRHTYKKRSTRGKGSASENTSSDEDGGAGSISTANDAKSVTESPKPATNEPKPAMDEPKPAVDEPKPAVDAPKPAVDSPKQTVVDITPAPPAPVAAPQPSHAFPLVATVGFSGVTHAIVLNKLSLDAFRGAIKSQFRLSHPFSVIHTETGFPITNDKSLDVLIQSKCDLSFEIKLDQAAKKEPSEQPEPEKAPSAEPSWMERTVMGTLAPQAATPPTLLKDLYSIVADPFCLSRFKRD